LVEADMSNPSTPLFGSALLPERFWDKVHLDASGCWLWTGARNDKGYGLFTSDGARKTLRKIRAHRASYLTLIGEVPDGLVLDHLCRVRHCVNPDHLEPVTHRVNLLRGETLAARNHKLTHCKREHPFDEANTWVDKKGTRHCRTCHRDRQRARVAAAKAA
jgi:hypothetical protein